MGAANATLQVGIGQMDWYQRVKEASNLTLQVGIGQIDMHGDETKPWPFLVEYKSAEEMETAIQSHLQKHPGKFVRLQMPEGPIQGERMATRWLDYEEWEMTCHMVDGLKVKADKVPVCHRAVPGDRFGITCLRYQEPMSNSVKCQKLGVACHRAW